MLTLRILSLLSKICSLLLSVDTTKDPTTGLLISSLIRIPNNIHCQKSHHQNKTNNVTHTWNKHHNLEDIHLRTYRKRYRYEWCNFKVTVNADIFCFSFSGLADGASIIVVIEAWLDGSGADTEVAGKVVSRIAGVT